MTFNIWQFFIAATAVLAISCSTESIQLQPTQGILIPAPLAQNIRVSRGAYGGGGGGGASSYSAPAPAPAHSYSAPAQSYSAPAPQPAAAPAYSAHPPAAAPAYAPTSIPAPPCPRNYLFSCQPSLQPVPCSAPAPAPAHAASYGGGAAPAAGGHQGAYSHYIPQYAVPFVKELY